MFYADWMDRSILNTENKENKKENKDSLLKIINHYGVNAQQRQFAEETFELQEAITKAEQFKELNHRYNIFNKMNITEEIADCLVMLKQIQEYYDIDDKYINREIEYKINRQLERIKKEEEK